MIRALVLTVVASFTCVTGNGVHASASADLNHFLIILVILRMSRVAIPMNHRQQDLHH